MTPYRQSIEEERPAPPQTLECVIGDGQKHGWFAKVAVKLFFVSLVVIFIQAFNVVVAIAVGVLGFAWTVWDVGRRNGARIVFRTERNRVYVNLPVPLDVSFAKLLDVRLDTKATSKALNQARADGLNSIFGPIIPDGRTIDVDQSRIELIVKGRKDPLLLSDTYVSSTLALENIRAIKVFLRKAGWLPADERPLEDRPKRKKKTVEG